MDLADKEWNRRCVAACQWLKNEGDVGVRELAAIAGVPPYVVCFAAGMSSAEAEYERMKAREGKLLRLCRRAVRAQNTAVCHVSAWMEDWKAIQREMKADR